MNARKLSIVVFALVAASLLVSCKKNNGSDAPKQGFAASTEQGGESKTHLSGVEVRWNAYDQIKVASQDNPTTQQYTFELTMGENTMDGTFYTGESYAEGFFDESIHNYIAIYPARSGNTITGANAADFTLPQEQSTQSSWQNSFGDGAMAMMAVSDNRRLPFKNLLGGLCLQLTGLHEHVAELWITSNDASEYLWGEFTAAWNSGNPTLTHKTGGTGSNTVKLTGCNATTSASTLTQTFYILLPPGTLKTGFTLTAYKDNGTTKIYEHTATWASNNNVIQRSKCRRLDSDSETSGAQGIDMAEGALPGLFSVSASKKVYFSKGNLQYQASTGTWRFAEHQWDFVGTQAEGGTVSGSDNNNVSSTYSGWIDMFCWATSGWDNGNIRFQPYDYYDVGGGPSFGPAGEYDLSGAYIHADWGIHNPISNGGGAAGRWHCLEGLASDDGTSPVAGDHTVSGFPLAGGNEWYYLLHRRSQKYRYALAQLTVSAGTVNGLMVFPDGFEQLPDGVPALVNYNQGFTGTSPYTANAVTYTNNRLTEAQWNILEAANVVFLPAAGDRVTETVEEVVKAKTRNVNTIIRYWTDTHSGVNGARCLRINSDGCVQTNNHTERSTGYPIRLVCDY